MVPGNETFSALNVQVSSRPIPVSRPDLQKIAGDAMDERTINHAVAGVDAVIQTLGVHFRPETILRGTRLFSVATRVLVTAMEEAGVKRLICVTGLGAGSSRDKGGVLYNIALHLFLDRIYLDKDAQEWIIRKSTLEWVLVRPAVLTNGPRTGAYRVLVDPQDWRSGFISRADVADFLVKQINDDALIRQAPALTD